MWGLMANTLFNEKFTIIIKNFFPVFHILEKGEGAPAARRYGQQKCSRLTIRPLRIFRFSGLLCTLLPTQDPALEPFIYSQNICELTFIVWSHLHLCSVLFLNATSSLWIGFCLSAGLVHQVLAWQICSASIPFIL